MRRLIESRMILVLLSLISASVLLWPNRTILAEQSGTLLIKCDAPIDCILSLDRRILGVVGPRKSQSFSVPVGQHLLGVRSSRFESRFYDYPISVGDRQTVQTVRPHISFKSVVLAAQMGRVMVRTKTETDLFVSIDGKRLSWDALTNHDDWRKSGYKVSTSNQVVAKPGVTIAAIGAAITTDASNVRWCFVHGQFLGVFFFVQAHNLAFVDQTKKVDLTNVVGCAE